MQGCLSRYSVIFVILEQALNQGRVADPNITKYSVKVLPVSFKACLLKLFSAFVA